jgi:serine/threonine-protein kinase
MADARNGKLKEGLATEENWRRIEELFNAARELPIEKHSGYLQDHCPDEALRREVQSLLAKDAMTEGLIDLPAWDGAWSLLESNVEAPLAEGAALGPYRITGTLGVGGMGRVYQANDARLGRSVAIKISRSRFSKRFELEARAIAALNHPNICTVYDVGPNYLVMELIDGATLADKIKKGPLPLPEALDIARQIADALEAAHEAGIVHRDLKPANIKLRPDGAVKVLDFGLAKVASSLSAQSAGSREGIIIGTAAYMSPEQARGETVDKRADIWAFGAVVYEMLTGAPLFKGNNVSEILAGVLKEEVDLSGLPSRVRNMLQNCLERDPRKRLRDIGDALRLVAESEGETSVRRRWWPWFGVAAAAAIAIFGLSVFQRNATPAVGAPSRFIIAPLVNGPSDVADPAISADGERVAYTGVQDGVRRVYIQTLTNPKPTVLAGSDGASSPFFSADGEWVGFFAVGKMKKAPVAGGPPEVIADATFPRGAAWGPDNKILYAPFPGSPLLQAPDPGGTPQEFTHFGEQEFSHRYPQFLPNGKAIIYAAGPSGSVTGWSEAHIVAQSLTTGERTVLVPRGTAPRYVEPGYLLYLQYGHLFAIAFDPKHLKVTGKPVALAEQPFQGNSGGGSFDVSRNGTLVFRPSSGLRSGTLGWMDRTGSWESLGLATPSSAEPRISPDGTLLAYTAVQPDSDVWVYDLVTKTSRPFSKGGQNAWPLWALDGKHLGFSSLRFGGLAAYQMLADGSGSEELLTSKGGPISWSPDGKILGVFYSGTGLVGNLHLLDMGGRSESPFGDGQGFETDLAFAPKGKWVAWSSNESGRFEVYVQAFPLSGKRWQISRAGGREPVWSRTGQELFFRNGDDMMAVDIRLDTTFEAGPPHVLFTSPGFAPPGNRANFDVSPDGKRFVMVKLADPGPPPEVDIVLNWRTALAEQMRPQGVH